MSESKIVTATIAPIKYSDLRLDRIPSQEHVAPYTAPLVRPDIFRVKFEGLPEQHKVTEDTIAHARGVALQLISRMGHFPHTTEAGDLLALCFSLLHFTDGK